MISFVKGLLHGLLGPTLYIGVWLVFLAGILKRAEWSLYLLAILAPLPVIWYQLHPFPMGKDTMDILIAGTFLGILINKGGFDRAPSAFLIGVFMLISFLAVWNSTLRFGLPLPFTTANPLLADWKNYVEMIFLYFLAYNALKNEEQQKIMLITIAAVFLLISVREFRNFSEGAAFSYDRRVEGPFWILGLGANHIGAFVAHYGGLLLGMAFIDKHKYRRWLYLAGVGFSLHPLFFSYSRGAYVGALAVIMLYGVLKKRSLLLVVALLVFTWQVVLPETVVERIEMTEDASGRIESSAAQRVVLWEHALRLFQDNFLFGIGFNSFGFTVEPGSLTDTHNFYMKTAAEQGLIGLIVLALVLVRALVSGWRLYREGHTDFHRALGFGFVGCTVAVMVTNIFGDRFSYFVMATNYWIVWGMVDRSVTLARTARATLSETVPEQPTQTATKPS